MLASIVIEYSAKSLNKVFDYIIPDELKGIIKVGHKVIVPFASHEVEGFVLKIHDNIDNSIDYKKIIKIQDNDFYLNSELLELGKYMSNSLLCSLINAYQVMLPKALKASIKTNINKKYISKVYINKEIDVEKYKEGNKRNKKEIEIIDKIGNDEILKSEVVSPSLNHLITAYLRMLTC